MCQPGACTTAPVMGDQEATCMQDELIQLLVVVSVLRLAATMEHVT